MHNLNYDDDGFLLDETLWDKDTGSILALQAGFTDLSESQWHIVFSLRDYYLSHHCLPIPRHICHTFSMPNNCLGLLFKNHGIDAWKIAGLPNPGEEAQSYM